MIAQKRNRPMKRRGAVRPSSTPSRADAPAVPPARSHETRRTLLRAQAADIDAHSVSRGCLRWLAKAVWSAAGWRWEDYGVTWKIGDFNFLILESTYADGAILYTQLWSEPQEQVVFEVCSGNSDAAVKPFIDPAARERLAAMGFTIGGEARNFRKLVTIASPADAEVVAGEMLAVFTDVFKYAGRTPLTIRVVRDERSSRVVVHESLTPEDLAKLLSRCGFEAAVVPGSSRPMIKAERNGAALGVLCDGRSGKSNLYSVFDFFFIFENPSPAQVEELAAIHRDVRFVTGVVDDHGDLTFCSSLSLAGGLTTEAIVAFARTVDTAMRQILRRIEKRARGERRPREIKTVH